MLHWVFKTATGGMEGIITNYQTAFAARSEGMKELKAEAHELTVIQLSTKSVRVMLAMPLPADGVKLKFPEQMVVTPESSAKARNGKRT